MSTTGSPEPPQSRYWSRTPLTVTKWLAWGERSSQVSNRVVTRGPPSARSSGGLLEAEGLRDQPAQLPAQLLAERGAPGIARQVRQLVRIGGQVVELVGLGVLGPVDVLVPG